MSVFKVNPIDIIDSVVVGTVNQVDDMLGKFEEAGCVYLIAYISDIVWGDTLELLKN